MLRSLRAQDFIQLPPLGEAGTLTLVDELEAAAGEEARLASSVYAALGRLLEAAADTKKCIAARERAGSAADPRARAADRALDDAWGAFQSWLLGWTRLPDKAHPRIAEARTIYASLFPKGLQFLTLDFKDEWNESQQRLDHVTEGRLDETLDALGGRPFLVTVARAHRTYGEALHITPGLHTEAGAPDDSEPDAPVRRAIEATHLALREYVAQVAATVRRTEPDSVGAAERLLEPLSIRAGSADSYEALDGDATLASFVG